MASINTRLLYSFALFLFLATPLTDSSLLPKINSQPALPSTSSTYIVLADHLAKPPHFATLEHWYTSMVASHSPRPVADHSSRILHTYDTVMHGFAVDLTGDEAGRMSDAVGVFGVHEDRRLHYMTTRTPGFLGLDPGFGAWRDTDSGDGIIIGIIDSGIYPESPSFSDSGLGPVRASWRGKCVDAADFNASLCNNKLVGAKAFGTDPLSSPRDFVGHGTHVASTAAGSEVRDAGFHMFARGTARGVAPKAKIAMYSLGLIPSKSSTVAAIDAAVKDGVDIISISIGNLVPRPFYNDTVSIAAFGAERAGVFVVFAAGNSGPMASTVDNAAPWMTTVGAGNVDRLFPAKLNLGDGTVLTGQSLYTMKANGTNMVPLLMINSCSKKTLMPDHIKGKIVACIISLEDKAQDNVDIIAETLQRAGAAGLVQVLIPSWSTDDTYADIVKGANFPALGLSYTGGKKLRAYMASEPYPVASFSFACETVINENRAPMVWTGSSRGPNLVAPELLKPDIIAPGVNILSAWPINGLHRGNYSYLLSVGTSMACPHVAGVAALIKKKHSDWTPAMIRSALITTAATLDNTGREIIDNAVFKGRGITAATPFAAGAGHVRPQLAMDPGLVYDASARDFIDFLCALNYTTEQLRLFAPDMATCTRKLPGGPAGFNYPSFVVVFDGRTDVRTLTRTVTKVSEEAEIYEVTVAAPEHVKVTVTPAVLEFKEHEMETKTYTAEFRVESGGNRKDEWDFGHISWESEKHRVRSPVAFQWKN
jgi:subtilisin family serine protease